MGKFLKEHFYGLCNHFSTTPDTMLMRIDRSKFLEWGFIVGCFMLPISIGINIYFFSGVGISEGTTASVSTNTIGTESSGLDT
jgi:hypothetical protein